MDAGRLGATQQRAHVLRILERVEDEDERRLAALGGTREHVGRRGEPARLDDERDALVAVETGDRGQRPALDLDDRDAQAGRVEDELLERGATLRHDQQSMGRAARGEDLLDRPPAGDQLLLGTEQIGRRERAGAWGPCAISEWLARPRPHAERWRTPERCARRSPRRAGGTAERSRRRARVLPPRPIRRSIEPAWHLVGTGSEAATGLARRWERAATCRSTAVGRWSRRAPVGASRPVTVGRPARGRRAPRPARRWGRLGPRIRGRAVATRLERPG